MDNLLWGTEHLPDEAPTSGGKLVPPVISTTSPARTARTVRVQPKPPFAFGRIGCSPSAEIAVRTAPNSPFAFDRSTHQDGQLEASLPHGPPPRGPPRERTLPPPQPHRRPARRTLTGSLPGRGTTR